MQHKNGILAIAVLLGVFSCTHREDDGIQKVKFQAVQADGPSTKTVLQADGSVFWSPGDAVSLFYGGATIQKTKLTAENTSAAAQTTFSGVLDGFLPDGSTSFLAVYPYAAETTFDGSAVTVTVPADQTAVAGTFASDAFVSIATSKDYTLQFYNLCGGIKFSVANQGITSVIFKGNNDEILAGQVQSAFDDNGKPVVTEVVKGAMELVLNAPEGGFEVGKWYYMVALPTTLSAGYTMTFLDAAGGLVAERVTDTAIAIKRAVWGRLIEADNVAITASNYLTFTSEGTTKLSMNASDQSPVLYYSMDAQNWVQWDYSELTFSANAPLYICGDNPKGLYSSRFESSGSNFAVSGSVMSLVDKDVELDAIPSRAVLSFLFYECSNLVEAPELPATTLTENCYECMFYGCSSLVKAPELPATTLTSTCYHSMFFGCSKLVEASELPANILAYDCYNSMFEGCSSLVKAPELPATTLARSCYYSMFKDCSSLVEAPELPATTLEELCYYQMFSGCTGLTTAPEVLPADVLSLRCYEYLFKGCTSLTAAPELPATTLAEQCYLRMFEGCSALESAPVLPATALPSYCYYGMFQGCTSLVTAPDIIATNLSYECCYHMFQGCTNLVNAPELPATTLANNCYEGMFQDCTNLVEAPNLPATILNNCCYEEMFSGCTKLEIAPVISAMTMAPGCCWRMFYKCTSLAVAPELPATTLASSCYRQMFWDCTSLITPPSLPATTLAEGCYDGMFMNCSSLVTAPTLPATTLVQSCYIYMFDGCSNLNYIKCLATDISAYDCILDWSSGVAGHGTFVKSANTQWPTGTHGIPEGWVILDDGVDYPGSHEGTDIEVWE